MITAVPDLKPGDQFAWCGTVVEFVEVEYTDPRTTRPGRRLIVLHAGERHSLHYFDDETVAVTP